MIEKTFPTLQYEDVNFLTGQVETVNLVLPLGFCLTLPDGTTIDATGLQLSVSSDDNPVD